MTTAVMQTTDLVDGEDAIWSDRVLRALVVLYVVAIPLQFELSDTLRIAVSDFALVGLILLFLPKLTVGRHNLSLWHVGLIVAYPLGVFVAAVNGVGITQWGLINKFGGMILLMVTYIVFSSVLRTRAQVADVIRLFGWAVGVINLVFVLAFVTGVEIPLFPQYALRLSGGLIDPNAYGGLLVAGAANMMVVRPPRERWHLALWVLVVCGYLAGLMLTSSRTAWIAAGVLWVALLFFRRRMAIFMGMGALLVAMGLFVFTDLGSEQAELAARTNTIDYRVDVYADATEEVAERPIFGLGLGGLVAEANEVVHNTVLFLFTDLGLLGAGSFLGLCGWVLWRGLFAGGGRSAMVAGPLLAHISMFAVALAIEAFSQRHWWLQMALVVAWANASPTEEME